MRFHVVSEADAASQAAGVWPNGTYDFEVREATEKTSSSGNEMIELEVWIFHADGGRRLVFDYLVATEKAAWKIRHFAAACGLLAQYETGNLMASEMLGRTGQCEVGTQAEKDGYPAKNVIRDYLPKSAPAARTPMPRPIASRAKLPAGDIDDEIPF